MSDPLDQLRRSAALERAANPFATGPGEVPPHFGGRRDQLEAAAVMLERLIARRYDSPRVLEGLRGVGKTSLMVRIREAAADNGIITTGIEVDRSVGADRLRDQLVDLLDRITPARKAKRLLGRLSTVKAGPGGVELALGGETPALITQLVTDIATVAAATDQPVLLTIDEAHEAQHGVAGVVRGLHAAAQQHAPVGAYLAGLPGTRDRIAELVTYAERLDVATLGLLDRDGVAEAISEPFIDHDVAVDDEVVDMVADHSGGYPYFVQVWGSRLWTTTTDDRRITPTTAQAAFATVERAVDSFLARRWNRLTAPQQAYVHAMANLDRDPVATGEIARALRAEPNAVSHVRRELLNLGIVYVPEYGKLGWSVPQFGTWVRATSDDLPHDAGSGEDQ